MQSKDMDKHLHFLIKYARENKILFRIGRTTANIEDVSEYSLQLKKQSKNHITKETNGCVEK